MRQKADKLEKGKWYADIDFNGSVNPAFLRYSHSNGETDFFSEIKGADRYLESSTGMIPFAVNHEIKYLPTPEDIEKYNLNEE